MVLFTSQRPLERAENIKAVYDAYDGEKAFARMNPYRQIPDLHSGKYRLQVTDELPSETVGKCLFIGHGMGANKKYGLDQPHPYFNRPDLITCAIASSKDIVHIVSKQCGISESQVVVTGMPRTDAYFKREKQPSEKRKYLYVPTFRAYKWWEPEWGSLNGHLNDDELFIAKPHMVTGKMLNKTYSHIVEKDSMIPSADFIIDSDIVITDYSSIMYDAYIARKPVVLFAKDRYKYLRQRGMYYPYPENYSEYFCDTEDSLINTLRVAKWSNRAEEIRRFSVGACDGRATERVIELIGSMI